MKTGDIPLKEYIITKQLTRSPSDYSDPKGLPHVQVALRLKKGGKSDAELVNNFIPYVMCQTVLGKDQKKLSTGDMAWSPDEFLKSKKEGQNELKVDTDWYITQQLLPPITRLIEHIEGIEVDFVAQCLGVDGKKYKFNQHATKDEDDDTNVLAPVMKTETTQKLQDRSVASLKI
jgi:DNA polymerase alpha subunit A